MPLLMASQSALIDSHNKKVQFDHILFSPSPAGFGKLPLDQAYSPLLLRVLAEVMLTDSWKFL